jgi:lycopene cyclase domain-containing protein
VSYTLLAVVGIVVVVVLDLFVFRTRLLRRRAFWAAYAIVVFFQLVTNGVLTGLRIVRYDGEQIMGSSAPVDAAPPFLGDGRIAFAPVEDLMFGFALVVLTQVLWVWLGRRGVERTPYSGPPRFTMPGQAGDPRS